MRPNGLAVVVTLVLGLAAVAAGDEVVLRNGSVLAGRIVKEDAASVTIERAGGEMTVAKADVKEIKRGAPPEARPPSGRDLDVGDAPPVRTEGKRATPKQGKSPEQRLEELLAIPLVPWEDEPSKPSDERDAKAYRVGRADGTVAMQDERPAKPDGIATLHVRNDADHGRRIELRDGRRQLYWYRLWWHADKAKWLVVSPQLEAFQKDCALATALADAVCVDENARIATHIDRTRLEHELLRHRTSAASTERARLRASCRIAMGSAETGDLLARVHELAVDIAFTKAPSAKIAFARERREVLRKLVAQTTR